MSSLAAELQQLKGVLGQVDAAVQPRVAMTSAEKQRVKRMRKREKQWPLDRQLDWVSENFLRPGLSPMRAPTLRCRYWLQRAMKDPDWFMDYYAKHVERRKRVEAATGEPVIKDWTAEQERLIEEDLKEIAAKALA